jgi:GNAT superfamily N-acetyltransferase
VDDLPIGEDEAREKLDEALAKEPTLTPYGFDTFGSRTSLVCKPGETKRDHEDRLARERKNFNLREFAVSYDFWKSAKRQKTFNQLHSSYGLKHIVARAQGTYIANGAFIAGAIAAGVSYRQIGDTPNVRFAISETELRALQKAASAARKAEQGTRQSASMSRSTVMTKRADHVNEAVSARERQDAIKIRTEVRFREVTGDLPTFPTWRNFGGKGPYYDPDARWFYAELHVSNHGTYGPTALAVVCENQFGVEVLSLFVVDHMRERGYGRQLMEVIAVRWPKASWCETPESRPFHQRLVASGIAYEGSCGHYQFSRTPTRE